MTELNSEQQAALDQQKDQCIFCKIVKGEQDSKKVYEDDLIIAILDINPASKGHLLVMPKEHYPIMPLIPVNEFEHLFIKTKELNQSLNKSILSIGSNVFIANGAAAGQQSNHFMLHIIPRDENDEIRIFNLKSKDIEEDKIKEAETLLRNNLPIMLNNHFARNPKSWHTQSTPHKLTEDQVVKVIEQNPQLKKLLSESPDMVKKSIPTNPQLQTLFKDVDFNKVASKFKIEKTSKSPTEVPNNDDLMNILGGNVYSNDRDEEGDDAKDQNPDEDNSSEEDTEQDNDEDNDDEDTDNKTQDDENDYKDYDKDTDDKTEDDDNDDDDSGESDDTDDEIDDHSEDASDESPDLNQIAELFK